MLERSIDLLPFLNYHYLKETQTSIVGIIYSTPSVRPPSRIVPPSSARIAQSVHSRLIDLKAIISLIALMQLSFLTEKLRFFAEGEQSKLVI